MVIFSLGGWCVVCYIFGHPPPSCSRPSEKQYPSPDKVSSPRNEYHQTPSRCFISGGKYALRRSLCYLNIIMLNSFTTLILHSRPRTDSHRRSLHRWCEFTRSNTGWSSKDSQRLYFDDRVEFFGSLNPLFDNKFVF